MRVGRISFKESWRSMSASLLYFHRRAGFMEAKCLVAEKLLSRGRSEAECCG